MSRAGIGSLNHHLKGSSCIKTQVFANHMFHWGMGILAGLSIVCLRSGLALPPQLKIGRRFLAVAKVHAPSLF